MSSSLASSTSTTSSTVGALGPGTLTQGTLNRYNFAPTNYFQRPDERYTAGAFVDYEISDAVKPYMEFMFMDDRTLAQIAPSGDFGNTLTVNCDNPLMSASQNSQICNPGNLINTFIGTFPVAGVAGYNPIAPIPVLSDPLDPTSIIGYLPGAPAINFPNARVFEKEQGRVAVLEPGESRSYELSIEAYGTSEAVAGARAEVAALQRGVKPEIHSTPDGGFAPMPR